MLALAAVEQALDQAGIGYEVAWSPVFRPGALRLEDAAPGRYTHLVFVCGPVHGAPVADLHTRFATLRRIAVGVSVIDPADPACRGFDLVLARDGDQGPPAVRPVRRRPALPAAAHDSEYTRPTGPGGRGGAGFGPGGIRPAPPPRAGDREPHRLAGQQDLRPGPVGDPARLPRLAAVLQRGTRSSTLLSRMDIVVTTRLHGLVLALRAGIPALAVDPVDGGGKVTAQASAWQWRAILSAVQAGDRDRLDELWAWCLSPNARQAAATAARIAPVDAEALLAALVTDLRSGLPVHGGRVPPSVRPGRARPSRS